MSKQRATADSWQTRPMPEARKELAIDGTFSRQEYEQITHGYIPQEQQDRWFIYFEAGWLYFHRSRTGTCVYHPQIAPIDDHYQAVKAIVNRDPGQYRNTDDEYDVALMSYLIDHLLLGRFAPFPTPRNLSERDKDRHRRHVIGQDEDNSPIKLRLSNNGRQTR
jgi:hypothetical protein